MDKYDTSQLTEFPRYEPESTQSGVSTFFNKFWKFPIFSPGETSEGSSNKLTEDSKGNVNSEELEKSEYDDKTETGTYAEELEGRSLPNVLRRISSLVALGSGVRSGTKYSDTELARYWMPDDISRECYECANRFSALRRRHHCRVCGQIFCSRCCSQTVPGHIFGCAGGLRVCNYCCNVVLSYLKENDLTGEISPDLKTLQENLQVKFPEHGRDQESKMRENFVFAGEQDDGICELRYSPKEPLHDIYNQLSFTLPTQQHRYRLVRYNGVWRGCDILQWIMDNTNNKTRAQANLVCQTLLSAGYMECMTELSQFADYALYKPVVLPPRVTDDDETPTEECNRLVESVSSYCLDLNLCDNSARLIKTIKHETKSVSSNEEEPSVIEQNDSYNDTTKQVCKAITECGEEHLKLLMRQCLARQLLSSSWLDVLYPLCVQAADIIMPDVHSNDIDVRNYVQVKKVPGGSIRESCVVQGVVLTKNVAHRGMPQQITNPTILLLDCSIAYQRVEGKLTSLEPVLLQEQEYLSRCAARIIALRARVVLARGRVSRAVQDALRARGLALACGVPVAALRRAARCARADPLASIDARVGTPRLGSCDNFYVKSYSGKTIMVLEGCAERHLGCCILLRGAPLQELNKVKKVVKFMLLACYNWKLEKSFLGDIEAALPESVMTFDDDSDKSNDDRNHSKNQEDAKVSTDSDDFSKEDVTKPALLNHIQAISDDKEAGTNEITQKSNESQISDKKSDSVASSDNSSNNDSFSDDKIFCNFNNTVTAKLENENKRQTDLNDDEEIIDDKLEETKTTVRKIDSDKTLSCGVPIRDFSDPLRSTLSVDDEVFLPKEEGELKADNHTDRWSTDDAVLVMSPNMIIPPPFLETEAGRRCSVRDYLPRRYYNTPRTLHNYNTTPPAPHRRVSRPHQDNLPLREEHPFIKQPISTSAEDPALKASLAHYRAVGCPPRYNKHKISCPLYKLSVVKKISKEVQSPEEFGDRKEDKEIPIDPLAPENHQRLSLLLYSFSNKSTNVPDFCVNPWIVTMEMYGRHDISLGGFLDKYCFNGDNRCTSSNCQVPMNQHVRRFVHGDVCITITCNTIGHSNVDKVKEEQTKQVMFWSRCETCGATGRGRRVRTSTLSVSLAHYLRWRCLATRYVRARVCPHPLHAHAHAFVCRLTTASFRYSKISTYDVELPADVISTKYDIKQMRQTLISLLNDLMLKGHETFNGLTDNESDKDYQSFKQHMETIHLALTSNSLQEHTTLAGVVRSLWNVSDCVITGEKMLRDAQDKWSTPLSKTNKSQPEVTDDKTSELEDAGEAGTTYVFATDNFSKELDKEHSSGADEDEEKGDKKTVRQILSQLLSNNQPANQVGMIVSSGLVPVVVQAGEVGSVVAATLASLTYRRACTTHRHKREATNKPTWQRRLAKDFSFTLSSSCKKSFIAHPSCTQTELDDLDTNSTGKEKNDNDKSKQAKSNDHVEVLLKDGLVCRVYYAAQFAALRHSLLASLTTDDKSKSDAKCCCHEKGLCDIEEGFIRSLAHCVPWAARGGKSGSTFCKTKDDRYVLKEMTKPEWQQFLEFAPHYFNYINTCRQNKQPSLLARIVGVYSVGGAGNGVLVMENVWYSCSTRAKRFDLKGSSRHRLAHDTQPLAVLMDENLLNLRWESPLYVECCSGALVWECMERDTQFLARLGVMDYSLLLGIDNNTLVLGIIDYIRTFTWDKKLEHLVKKNLGSGEPTVVSPEQYKLRFLAACRKYFLQVPAHWDILHTQQNTESV